MIQRRRISGFALKTGERLRVTDTLTRQELDRHETVRPCVEDA